MTATPQARRLKRRRGLKFHPADLVSVAYRRTRKERQQAGPHAGGSLWWAPDDSGNYSANIALGERYAYDLLVADDGTIGYGSNLACMLMDIGKHGAGPHGVALGFFNVIYKAARLGFASGPPAQPPRPRRRVRDSATILPFHAARDA
jgi:hypothetical protein